jgi:hypothetical protein
VKAATGQEGQVMGDTNHVRASDEDPSDAQGLDFNGDGIACNDTAPKAVAVIAVARFTG